MLKIHHEPCGYECDLEFLCPQCGLPFCDEDSQQAQGGALLGHIINWRRINYDLKHITKISADYTVQLKDNLIIAYNDLTEINILLPAMQEGKRITIKRMGDKKVIIMPSTGTIDCELQYALISKQSAVTLITDGSDWFIEGAYP